MVVCNAPVLPLSLPACPVTPNLIQSFASRLCQLSPVPQRFPVLASAPFVTTTTDSTCEVPYSVPKVEKTVQYTYSSPVMQPSIVQCLPGVVPSGTVELCQVAPPPTTALSLQQSLCSVPAAPSWKQSYGMEQVWQCEFRTLFSQYSPHVWILLPVLHKPTGVWNANVDSAKVRFCCENCGHGWTSMKGRVAFWFVLNPTTGEGMVCLKLYGQQCDRCKTGNYEPAMWYPEEVVKVLVNIYNRVGQVYYGFQQAPYHKARRPGKPRTPHNSELCQACKDGVCSERR